MSYRFFLDSKPDGEKVILEGDQAHHASQVMRFKSGDEVVLFDGSGLEYHAAIDNVSKKRVELTIVERVEQSRCVKNQVTLAVALPKGDRQKFLIEKVVELGVTRIVPLKTVRSVAVANEKVIQRLRKQVIEASKQCGRNTLMEVAEEHTLKSLDALVSADHKDITKLIADPYQGIQISEIANDSINTVVVAIGPEGGFDESEYQTAIEMGFKPIRLGPAILRVETAALAVAAILGIGKGDKVEPNIDT
jgi:16S rRNA (uracil1498-N3)-methyltransferase